MWDRKGGGKYPRRQLQGKQGNKGNDEGLKLPVTSHHPGTCVKLRDHSSVYPNQLKITRYDKTSSIMRGPYGVMEFHSEDLSIDFKSDLNIATQVFVFLDISPFAIRLSTVIFDPLHLCIFPN